MKIMNMQKVTKSEMDLSRKHRSSGGGLEISNLPTPLDFSNPPSPDKGGMKEINMSELDKIVPQHYPLWVRVAHDHDGDVYEVFVPIIGWVERPTSCGHSTYLRPVVASGHAARDFAPRDACPWTITGRGPFTGSN
ncbi:hypothetical protein Aple_034300 [Acrocarpospora pleiomorpha]|uniref:Uncharacterized protein n=1 Tax=Acrocarpospora pleiomorpha TaxID=90975 RepID=A0A5M3XGY4_9ACTN|nr:hypothetical protein [Acrocarpospora pleiomorpha]GES20534.1 hypothetical protein Aple_034300 [Acrocarpospora pleiomorpha]